jgi:transcriptional regulator with GAF, ATPase, and Fis domain
VRYFLEREEGSLKVSKNVMDSFTNYLWPGNIRELESVIRRAALLARAEKRTMVNMKDLTEELVQAVEGSIAIEEQIMESFREKGFSRSSVSETANELGGLNRGTVAEYLRGQCLQAFAEQGFNVERTVQHISLSADQEVNTRVRKKLLEYINNISDVVDTSQPWEAARLGLKPKTKNLPQRYHPYLEKTAEAFYRGVWKRTGQPSDSEGGSA